MKQDCVVVVFLPDRILPLLVAISFFFLMELGFELRASLLQSRCSPTWATPPVHFALVILEMGALYELIAPAGLNLPGG
jgi:hypothetical protein